jgi:hypothetical protein
LLNCRAIGCQVVVLTSVETKEVLERWEFKVEYEEGQDQGEGSKENVDSNMTSQRAIPVTSEKGYRNVSNKVHNQLNSNFDKKKCIRVQ